MPDRKRRKVTKDVDLPTTPPTQSQNSFFNQQRFQTAPAPSQPAFPSQVLLLIVTLIEELKKHSAELEKNNEELNIHNAIEILKMQRQDNQKVAEEQSAKDAEIADQERFKKCGGMFI